jgi:hypothetical protein
MPFESARPVDLEPHFYSPNRDPSDWLPGTAVARFDAIGQRVKDTYALLTPSEDLRELHQAARAAAR